MGIHWTQLRDAAACFSLTGAGFAVSRHWRADADMPALYRRWLTTLDVLAAIAGTASLLTS